MNFRPITALACIAVQAAVPATGAARPSAPAAAKAPTVASPVARVLDEWLTAFNARDTAALKAFYGKRLDDPDAAFAIDSAEDTGGFDIVRVEASSPLAMTLVLRERGYPELQRLKIELESETVAKLKSFDLDPFALPGNGALDAAAAVASRLAACDAFAGGIVAMRGDRMLLARSWGLADRGAKTPLTLDTPMLLASAGKMFTGVAVLQLVDAGKIDLDAPLGRYLTTYPNADMAKVTLRQLLSHRGGTGDIGILQREDAANRARFRTIDDIVKLNGERGPAFPPGSKDDYSNYGFILLGAVIEKVTGGSYYDYIAEHVFKPAGMTHSGFPDRDHLQGVAVPYTTYFGAEPKLVAATDTLPWRGASAGGGVASPNDMLRFLRALKAGNLLSPAMLKLATTHGDTPWYGMGFVVDPAAHSHWGHGGDAYGTSMAFAVYPENDTIFLCMASRDFVCNRVYFTYHFRTFGISE